MSGPVLVTGAAGFVGSHLADDLLARGEEVTCLVRRTSNTRWLAGKPVRLAHADLVGEASALAPIVSGHRTVYHVAGAVRALSYEGFLRVNAQGTEELIKACLAAPHPPERFVLVSSVAASGPAPECGRLTERQEPKPVTDYGRSKLEGERCALRFTREIRVVIVRPTVVYGRRDQEILPLFRMARLGLVLLAAGRSQVHNFCHVSDIVQGVALAGAADVASGETFILGARREYTMAEIGEILCALFERKPRFVPLPRALLATAALTAETAARLRGVPAMLNRQKVPEILASWRLDLSAARSRLGYDPRVDLPEGAADTLRWYRSRGLV